MKYTVEIKLSKNSNYIEKREFELDKSVEETYYDDLLERACDCIDKEFPEEDFPNADVHKFWINDVDGTFPVVEESDQDTIDKLANSHEFDKFLVLPSYRYSIHPAYALYMKLCDEGIIDEEEEPYDAEKYIRILETIKSKIDNANSEKSTDED